MRATVRATVADQPSGARARTRRVAGPAVPPIANLLIPQPLPRWIGANRGGGDARRPDAEGQARDVLAPDPRFAAGAAVFALDQMVRANPPWLGCWRMRFTLKAATTLARRLRLGADAAALRDALHLTRAGDDPGPAGRLHLQLRRLCARPLRLAAEAEADILQGVAAQSSDSPAIGEIAALLALDRALAERLGWASPLPLHLAGIDDPVLRDGQRQGGLGRLLRADDAGLDAAGPILLLRSALAAHADAVTLARRAEAAVVAAATLRTRDEGRGLALILADDSVAPWRMAGKALGKDGMGSDRAARRFCESLHARSALRLLTDRPAFRLYGL